jgi:hypothetical protein
MLNDIVQHTEEARDGFRSCAFADDGIADSLRDIGQLLLKVAPLLRQFPLGED